MSRPEEIAPPEVYYNDAEVHKYMHNNHIIDVQSKLTERALELLLLPHSNSLLLDLGCGCGTSGKILNEHSHSFIGIDISMDMLLGGLENDVEDGDFIYADIGQLMKFRPGSFDGAISISAIQWLCTAFEKTQNAYKRLLTFFKWLYSALNFGSRAVFQFYASTSEEIEMISSAAMKCGFGGGIVVDYPNSTKAKKQYLVLWAGFSGSAAPKLPSGKIDENLVDDKSENKIKNTQRDRIKMRRKKIKKGREWVLHKKSKQRMQGMDVRPDTKYTARKRKDKF